MPTPKPALASKITPKTPQLVWGSDREAVKQAIRRRIAERAYFCSKPRDVSKVR